MVITLCNQGFQRKGKSFCENFVENFAFEFFFAKFRFNLLKNVKISHDKRRKFSEKFTEFFLKHLIK